MMFISVVENCLSDYLSVVYFKIFYSRSLYQQKEQGRQEREGGGGLTLLVSAFLLQQRGEKVSKIGNFQAVTESNVALPF